MRYALVAPPSDVQETSGPTVALRWRPLGFGWPLGEVSPPRPGDSSSERAGPSRTREEWNGPFVRAPDVGRLSCSGHCDPGGSVCSRSSNRLSGALCYIGLDQVSCVMPLCSVSRFIVKGLVIPLLFKLFLCQRSVVPLVYATSSLG